MFLKSPNYYKNIFQYNIIKTSAHILSRSINFLNFPYKPCKWYLFRGEIT